MKATIQKDVLKMLNNHPEVAWAIDFRSELSSIIGQMIDGRLLAIEVKQPGKEPTSEQYEFLAKVNANRGIGFWVYSPVQVDQIMSKLDILAAV